jgi:TusE/DsrC/DsvC family sulfur relay protein
MSSLQLPDGQIIDLDEKGYLLDYANWSPDVASLMASVDEIDLTADHWLVIEIFRRHFERFDIEPPMRALVKQTREKLGDEKGNSRFLYQLFPYGPGIQACRYAGLPRPVSCV